ncbi:MAG: type II toxin-antitoxin system YafQ family toxin [Pseudanabaena sp.]
MREIGWTPKSIRAFKRLVRKNPQLRTLLEKTLLQLAEEPFHPSLRTHKLMGDLSDLWSCSVDYSYRILFQFVQNPDNGIEAILLINIGSHDEVY